MNPIKDESKAFNKDFDYGNAARELYRRILETDDSKQKKEFVQGLFEKYKELEDSKIGEYTQSWTAYNTAQQKEKIFLINILNELLNYIPFPEIKQVGRKPVSTRDKIFYLVMQAYNQKSSRRCVSDLEMARRIGYIQKTPHFNTILKCMKDKALIDYFKHLINVSGIPLQQVETDFAVDSSGFSTSLFGRWFDVRMGTDSEKRKFVKAHLTCGVKTNIITAVNITKGYDADSPQFEDLVRQTNRVYNIKEISADKAYSSRANLQQVADLGALPFIPFKSIVKHDTKSKGADIWRRMYVFFTNYQQQFYHHYHKRSNSESTFHSLKIKFGSHLRSKDETGQANEIMAKCLCHNLCVLIQEALEIGIELDFNKCANIDIAHN